MREVKEHVTLLYNKFVRNFYIKEKKKKKNSNFFLSNQLPANSIYYPITLYGSESKNDYGE